MVQPEFVKMILNSLAKQLSSERRQSMDIQADMESPADAAKVLDVPDEGIEDMAEVTMVELDPPVERLIKSFPTDERGLVEIPLEHDKHPNFVSRVRSQSAESHLLKYLQAGWHVGVIGG